MCKLSLQISSNYISNTSPNTKIDLAKIIVNSEAIVDKVNDVTVNEIKLIGDRLVDELKATEERLMARMAMQEAAHKALLQEALENHHCQCCSHHAAAVRNAAPLATAPLATAPIVTAPPGGKTRRFHHQRLSTQRSIEARRWHGLGAINAWRGAIHDTTDRHDQCVKGGTARRD